MIICFFISETEFTKIYSSSDLSDKIFVFILANLRFLTVKSANFLLIVFSDGDIIDFSLMLQIKLFFLLSSVVIERSLLRF